MPFKSEAQRRFLHARHSGIAKRWEREGGTPKDLPAKLGSQSKSDTFRKAVAKRRKGK